ncbi:zinc finger protein 511 isoform X2 [Hyla sarda]|uniref:zinc finger protein 511 isoform X2 n=1 Tax=Hyla sarda TaxID=327740 RepID=UPI0024C2A9EB|nr:zinc finger protein 511 isoform X2 [Hyla sarda]
MWANWIIQSLPPGSLPRYFNGYVDGDVHRHLYLQNILTGIGEVEARSRVSEFPCQVADCAQLFDTLESFEHHYNTLHRNVCSTCKRSFPSVRLLDIHILEWHDSLFQIMAEKTSMFQCLVEGCMEKFETSGKRKNHLIKAHLYPSDFRFGMPKKNKSKTKQECCKNQSMDIMPEESSLVESMEISVLSTGDHSSSHASVSSMPHNKPRVPSTICFGRGSMRGFRHAKKKK